MQKRKSTKRKRREKVIIPNNILASISYKNPHSLSRFLTPRFKILGKSRTTVSAKLQRKVSREIKKARIMGLLPFTERHKI